MPTIKKWVCQTCGIEFGKPIQGSKGYKYCSPLCSNLGKKIKRTPPNCKFCDKQIVIIRARDYNKRYCNSACAGKANVKEREPQICENCNKEFLFSYVNQNYCSYTCMGLAQRSSYTKTCLECGEDFILNNKAYERRGAGLYCSRKCSSLANRKYKVNTTYFNQIDTHEKAYWLGFLFADGYQNGYEVIINLGAKDSKMLEYFLEAVESTTCVKTRDRNQASVRIGSIEICRDLNRHGCVQAKSLILPAPSNVAEEFLPSLVRGYFDGDGCVTKPSHTGNVKVSIHCAGDEFRNWLFSYLRDTVNIKGVTNPPSQSGRNICISNLQGIREFYALIYDNATEKTSFARKQSRFLEAFRIKEERGVLI